VTVAAKSGQFTAGETESLLPKCYALQCL